MDDRITSDIEILGGELAGTLFDVTKDDVPCIFGDMIESLEEIDNEIYPKFANGTSTTAFDLGVAVDGIDSKIRSIASMDSHSHVTSLGSYVSYFSIPPTDTDTMWARVHWIKGGRNIVLRPDNVRQTRAFLLVTAYGRSDERLARLERASEEGISAQDDDWEIPRYARV